MNNENSQVKSRYLHSVNEYNRVDIGRLLLPIEQSSSKNVWLNCFLLLQNKIDKPYTTKILNILPNLLINVFHVCCVVIVVKGII
jgi:hypothetical protein